MADNRKIKTSKAVYACQECGAQFPKWSGQCADCGKWNTIVEELFSASVSVSSLSQKQAEIISEINLSEASRISTGSSELDRVLGGGLVMGSVVLIGGDPGIGKSTLLLQSVAQMSLDQKALYVTGEESLQQVALRAKRLELPMQHLKILVDTEVENILIILQKEKPRVLVIDSIQTMFTNTMQSPPGGVAQVRECAAKLVRYAKEMGIALFFIGHVTREGTIAGPRVLEHMVDTVLYFESDAASRYRIIRAVKNRFGAVNEIAIFAMVDRGLKQVSNPSAIFISGQALTPGSLIMAMWEGTRPLLIELQTLVDQAHLANPRRITLGLDLNRLIMLLAVLHQHAGVALFQHDVFANIVGGVKITETAADLPVCLAIVSSLRKQMIPQDLIAFGEIGLGGEIRPVQNGQERLFEAHKHGFKRAIIPELNKPKVIPKDMQVFAVKNLREALEQLW